MLLTRRKENNPGGHAKLSGFSLIEKLKAQDCGKKPKLLLHVNQNPLSWLLSFSFFTQHCPKNVNYPEKSVGRSANSSIAAGSAGLAAVELLSMIKTTSVKLKPFQLELETGRFY